MIPKKLKTKVVHEFDGYSGKLKVHEIVNSTNAVVSHSQVIPEFSIGFRVKELKEFISHFKDEEIITITVSNHKPPTWSFVK